MLGWKTMGIAIVVVLLLCSAAHADTRYELDNLLPPDGPASVVETPAPRIDMLAAPAPHRNHDRLWQAIDVAALAVSTASLACDWQQTRGASQGGWMGGRAMERNPLLGEAPSPQKIDMYFAGTVVINIVLWMTLPKRYRSLVPVAVVAAESRTIYDNIPHTGMCGF